MERADWWRRGYDSAQARFLIDYGDHITALGPPREHENQKAPAELTEIDVSAAQSSARARSRRREPPPREHEPWPLQRRRDAQARTGVTRRSAAIQAVLLSSVRAYHGSCARSVQGEEPVFLRRRAGHQDGCS